MAKLGVMPLLVLLSSASLARADGSNESTCEKDPQCYARELAATLTEPSPVESSVELRRVVDFEPGRVRVYSKSREKLHAIVDTWRQHGWSVITVHAHATGSAELAQRRADKIRGYLIRYGIPPEMVVASGDAGGAAVDLSIAVTRPR